MKRLLIVGSEDFTVHAMRYAVHHTTGVSLFGVIDVNQDVRTAVREARPDVVVLDGLGATDRALQSLADVRAELPDAFVLLVVASISGADAARALQAGALVCMWPNADIPAADAPEAPTVLAWPSAGGAPDAAPAPAPAHSPLTSREIETLRWVTEGHTNAWIARKLWVTEQTVKFHLTNIYRKLGVANRTEASHYALVNGLLGSRPRSVAQVEVLEGGRQPLVGSFAAREEINGHLPRRSRTS